MLRNLKYHPLLEETTKGTSCPILIGRNFSNKLVLDAEVRNNVSWNMQN